MLQSDCQDLLGRLRDRVIHRGKYSLLVSKTKILLLGEGGLVLKIRRNQSRVAHVLAKSARGIVFKYFVGPAPGFVTELIVSDCNLLSST